MDRKASDESGLDKKRGQWLSSLYRFVFYYIDSLQKTIKTVTHDFYALAIPATTGVLGRGVVLSTVVFDKIVIQKTPGLIGIPVNILRFVVGGVLTLTLAAGLMIFVSVSGFLASLLGFRNIAEYSFREQIIAWSPLLIFLLIFPVFASEYYLYKFCTVLAFIIVLVGLDFLFGQCGIVSVGHASFILVGSYMTYYFYSGSFGYEFPFIVSAFFGGLVAAAIGALLAIPSLRMKDEYLLVVTLGFALAVPEILKGDLLSEYTGVAMGGLSMMAPSAPEFLKSLSDRVYHYYMVAGSFVVLIYFAYNLASKGFVGRAFKAIKCDDQVSKILGVSVFYYKVLAFTLSAFYAGFAGGLFMLLVGFISADNYNFFDTIEYLVALVIGGAGTMLGATLGGIFMSYQTELTGFVAKLLPQGEALYRVGFGLLIIFFSIFFPRGVAGHLTGFLKTKIIPQMRRGRFYFSPPQDYRVEEIKYGE